MELIFLILGVGLGVVGSRATQSFKKPVDSTPWVPQAANSGNLQPSQEEQQPLQQEPNPPLKEEPQSVSGKLQPLEEELKQTQLAYEMAKEMSQFKGGFLARTAHELRSPLSSLIGMHQLILGDLCDSPEEAREFVAHANNSALKMVKLLDEVIDIAKTEHGTNRLELRSFPLTPIFEDVYRLTHMQAGNNNLQFELVPPDPEIYVLADSRRFRQVLMGIVDAAIAQLSERKEGSIKVWATPSEESQEVCIWIDVQCPMSVWSETVDLLSQTPEVKEQHSETGKASPGLTLLMVQTLVEVMQGRLEMLPISNEESTASSTENLTRLRCSMPLGTPETVEPALA